MTTKGKNMCKMLFDDQAVSVKDLSTKIDHFLVQIEGTLVFCQNT